MSVATPAEIVTAMSIANSLPVSPPVVLEAIEGKGDLRGFLWGGLAQRVRACDRLWAPAISAAQRWMALAK